MFTHNIPLCYGKPKEYPRYASRYEAIINSQWLELPFSRKESIVPKVFEK